MTWKSLQAGDKVRLTCIPEEYCGYADSAHEHVLAIYRRLIDEKTALCVEQIDGEGIPWTEAVHMDASKQISKVKWLGYSFPLDNNCWERVDSG